MAQTKEDLNSYFCSSSENGLPPNVLGELESILRLHSISAQELFYKWESYSLKMGSEETKLDLDTVRMFKKDVQDGLEREHRGKHTSRTERRSAVAATPRAVANGDVFGMYGPMN
jgi:DNA polymerase alpha subunit B